MSSVARKLYELLDARERGKAVVVFLSMFLAAAIDMAGVAAVMPFTRLALAPEEISEVPLLGTVQTGLGLTPREFVPVLGFVVLALLLAALLARAGALWIQTRFAARRKHVLSHRLLARQLHQPYESFLGRHSSEASTAVLDEALRAVDQCLFPFMQSIASGLIIAFLGGLLIVVDPVLAGAAILVLGGSYSLVFVALRRFNSRIGQLRERANRERYRLVQEAFGGMKDVKLLGLEDHFTQRFFRPSADVARAEASARLLQETPRFAMQGIVFGVMILAVLYLFASSGGLAESMPLLAGFAFAGMRLLPSLQTAYSSLTQVRYGSPALTRLHATLVHSEPPLHPSGGAAAGRLVPKARIELQNVGYRYPGSERLAVDDVSLRIPVNATVGIVGATGSGKTTLLDLLLGLLRPGDGALVIDEEPLDDGRIRAWQNGIGYVPQQIYLTDDTVAANIAFGVAPEQIDHDAVERAARIAKLHDFVLEELPSGYDTPVGERGVRLSGGQRQRIGIARALYRDPAVLFLDEATSALDGVTESAVMDAIHALQGEKTIVMIAHRLSTIRDCSLIFVMEQGRVVDAGSWDELIARNAGFRDLARLSAA